MYISDISFYPEVGVRNSPKDSLDTLCSEEEKAGMVGKFEKLRTMPTIEWPIDWAKPIQEFKQLTHGDFRALYKVIEINIIIFHIFRKTSNHTKKEDLKIAQANFNDFILKEVNDEKRN